MFRNAVEQRPCPGVPEAERALGVGSGRKDPAVG